jgi:hypothetical protein
MNVDTEFRVVRARKLGDGRVAPEIPSDDLSSVVTDVGHHITETQGEGND